jgi:signal transduction histidine kinase/ActR/RegA family two-component response regulator
LFLADGITPMKKEDVPLFCALQGCHVKDVEMVIAPKQGKKRILLASGQPFYDEHGEVFGAVVSMHDVTDRKYVEKALVKAHGDLEEKVRQRTFELQQSYEKLAKEVAEREEMEAKLRQAHKLEAIGTLAGGIAHDFNNILATILGYADMALDDIPEYNPAKFQIEQVMKAGNRAKNLVKHILSFSRMEAHERIPVQMHLIANEALELLRASIPTTVDIQHNIDPSCGSILADPNQIHQIFMNLCANAAQAMDDEGGVLGVYLDCVEFGENNMVEGAKVGSYVRLVVKDTGGGIDPKVIGRIFDPYFTTKEIGKGSGMGLAVVHGIVQSHDGMITVESKPGKGTTFHLYFPRIKDPLLEENEDIGPLPTGTEKILVVDDEEDMADVTKRRAERLGYQVTAKTCSTEALELFRSQPDSFDLVITDQTMPGLTGEQLAKELRRISPEIPIIICTGYSPKIDADKANLVDINAFIMKPMDKKEFAKTIRKVLDGDTSKTL